MQTKKQLLKLFNEEVKDLKCKCFNSIHDYIMQEEGVITKEALYAEVSKAFREYADDLSELHRLYLGKDTINKSMEDFYIDML